MLLQRFFGRIGVLPTGSAGSPFLMKWPQCRRTCRKHTNRHQSTKPTSFPTNESRFFHWILGRRGDTGRFFGNFHQITVLSLLHNWRLKTSNFHSLTRCSESVHVIPSSPDSVRRMSVQHPDALRSFAAFHELCSTWIDNLEHSPECSGSFEPTCQRDLNPDVQPSYLEKEDGTVHTVGKKLKGKSCICTWNTFPSKTPFDHHLSITGNGISVACKADWQPPGGIVELNTRRSGQQDTVEKSCFREFASPCQNW